MACFGAAELFKRGLPKKSGGANLRLILPCPTRSEVDLAIVRRLA
jgi:hypothetical protein